MNLFAREVPIAWSAAYFKKIYLSVIFVHTCLALLITTQWWFRWQKMPPDWLWGGLVHLNLCTLVERCFVSRMQDFVLAIFLVRFVFSFYQPLWRQRWRKSLEIHVIFFNSYSWGFWNVEWQNFTKPLRAIS